MKGGIVFFFISLFCSTVCFSRGINVSSYNLYHLDFVFLINERYVYGIVDSMFCYDLKEDKYLKINKFYNCYGGINVPVEEYEDVIGSDTIVFYYNYEDEEKKINFRDRIKIPKEFYIDHRSFFIEVSGFYPFGKRKKGWYERLQTIKGADYILKFSKIIELNKCGK